MPGICASAAVSIALLAAVLVGCGSGGTAGTSTATGASTTSGGAGAGGASTTAASAGTTTSGGGPVCGNGIREQGEACDGTDFGSSTCVTAGYASGTLACTPQCALDPSGCSYPSWGNAFVEQLMYSTSKQPVSFTSLAAAAFFDPASYAPLEIVGPCERRFAPSNGSGLKYVDGGAITITGGAVSPIHLTPATSMIGTTYSDGLTGNETLFTTGAMIHFASAGGSSIPAFSGQVAAPAPITITQPADFDSMSTLPATFSWTSTGATRVNVAIGAYSQAAGGTGQIGCEVADSAGTITVPASLMAKLPASPSYIYAVVTRSNVQSVNVGMKSVKLWAATVRQRQAP